MYDQRIVKEKRRTPIWVKRCKIILGIIILYLLLILLVQWCQGKSDTIQWSFITTLYKVSKVIGIGLLYTTGIILFIAFITWCFSED